ncbi:MAG: T9SS type A sorting domain-containing protein [Flavobacteriales bacterium]|nr:T9SS type A sorting domain-containing protein [Flavobacteriales bacterium]
MKKLLLLISFIQISVLQHAQWTSMNAPDSLTYNKVAVHPSGQKIMTTAYVYNSTTFQFSNYFVGSTDGGSTWTVYPGDNVMDAFWLGDAYYIHTLTALKKSSDMGASFETVITSPPGWGMIAVAQNGNLVIFNDAWDYPNYSTDGGYTWQSGTGTTPDGMNSYLVTADDVLLAGIQHGVLYSEDHGITWNMSTYNGTTTWPVLERKSICQAQDGTLYQMEGNIFNVSTDGGFSWNSVAPATLMSTLIDAQTTGNSLVTIGIYDVYTSTDGAVNFSTLTNFTSQYDLEKGINNDIWCGRQFGVYKFQGGGASKIENVVASIVSIYPNPCQDKLLVSGLQSMKQYNLSIYDVAGRLVQSHHADFGGNTHNLDTVALHEGTYLLLIQDDHGNISTSHFVKR